MKVEFIILGFVCMFLTCAAYMFNQTRRADWIMDLVGIFGYLAFLAMPVFFVIGFSAFL